MALSDADVQKQVMLIQHLSCQLGELTSANFVEPSVIKLTIQRLAHQSSSNLDIAPCAFVCPRYDNMIVRKLKTK